MTPTCPYCNEPSEFVTGREVYPHRPDLWRMRFYSCAPCKAWVGCHRGTDQPLGRLANAELRAAKQRAHAAFDPRWQRHKRQSRESAYRWLAQQLGIPESECHIGMFDVETCERVVTVCGEAAMLAARGKP